MSEATELEALKHSVARLEQSSARIEVALLGDQQLGVEGLVARQERDKRRVQALEKWQGEVKLRVAFLSGASSLVVLLAKEAWDYFTGGNGKH